MAEPLDDYRAKRDFGRTPEPAPEADPRGSAEPVFVVHRHEARRLHYDLRLEMNGVLASWAIPKGFSYDPRDKHLAVRTEDHPMEYESFSGVIPKGEYGAGTMTIWDRGRYRVVQESTVEGGELKVVLLGRRLRGEWHLVKTKQAPNHWLIFKSKDRYAGKSTDSSLGVDLSSAVQRGLPRSVQPMRPGEVCEPFSELGWLYEMKFEGVRALAEKRGDQVKLRGVRRKLPAIEEALGKLHCENALIDGMLVATDENERPSAERTAAALANGDDDELSYYAWDLLFYDEFDLRPLRLLERKAGLRTVLPEGTPLLYVDHVLTSGESLAAAVAQAGLPGIIAKRCDSEYASGAAEAWREVRVEADAPAAGPVTRALAREEPRPRGRVKLTNLDKVYWPAEGFTKGDLIHYYERVADVLLPYFHERPVHMNRFPDGIHGKSFYQRQAKEDTPEWVERIPIESGSKDEAVDQLICNDRDTLIYLANSGSIDMHPWMSRRGHLDSPDWSVIDLDPKGAPFRDVVRIAIAVGKVLRGVGIQPAVKTSGKTGMHIFIGLREGYTYEQSRMFAEAVARFVARDHPEIATVERVVDSRGGRVYIDFLQNIQSQTVVPPYVVRPVAGATVSTPLAWDEVDLDLDPHAFTIQTVPERIERFGDLFRPLLTEKHDLLPAIERLQEMMSAQ